MKKLFLFIAFVLVTFISQAQDQPKSREEESTSALEQGIAKADNNDWKGALNDYSNAIAYNPKNALAYYRSGIARENLKDYRGAIVDFSKAIYLNNADGASYYERGICYHTLGNKEKCCFDLVKSSGLGYSDADLAVQNYCN